MEKMFQMPLKSLLVVLVILGLTRVETVGNQEEMYNAHSASGVEPLTLLMGLGDSLTHGTMDGTNNFINTLNAYLQRTAHALMQVSPLIFTQPFFDEEENRLFPRLAPSNLGVDGADVFSLEGIEYYKRAGVKRSFLNRDYLCDKLRPGRLQDKYDKVLYPINLLAGRPVSQIDSAIWILSRDRPAFVTGQLKAFILFWVGNNDSSLAALGSGGKNPTFLPVPLDQIEPEISPELSFLLRLGQLQGDLSFAPYTRAAIERNLTELQDFENQYHRLLTRLEIEGAPFTESVKLFLLTLPYYSLVGYLFDSEDLEYYLQKLNPAYTVPPTFKRVAPSGGPILDPVQGDRISLLTFGFMYSLLNSGYSVDYVNQILEVNGQQRDDLVLSEEEQRLIMSRIDGFNATIRAAAAQGSHRHLIDIGQYLNDALTGKTTILVGNRIFSRKWVRGGSFSLDGVHPGYTGQALIANFVLTELNQILGLQAPLYELSSILESDPYVDRDGDGWAPGPSYNASGLPELLFLFKDPDDGNPTLQVTLPPDVWDQISEVLLREILGIPSLRTEVEHQWR